MSKNKMDREAVREAIKAAIPALEKGERVEIVPVKDGLLVLTVGRSPITRIETPGK